MAGTQRPGNRDLASMMKNGGTRSDRTPHKIQEAFVSKFFSILDAISRTFTHTLSLPLRTPESSTSTKL
jgi:hypothetical protein